MTATFNEYPPYDTPEEKEAYHNQVVVEHELIKGSVGLFHDAATDANQVLDAAICKPSRGMRILSALEKRFEL